MSETIHIIENERFLQGVCCTAFAVAGSMYINGPDQMIPTLIVVGVGVFIAQFYYHRINNREEDVNDEA